MEYITVIPGDEAHQWDLKRSKRNRRLDRYEKEWYEKWGLDNVCRVCGGDHQALTKTYDQNGRRLYRHNCPISVHSYWPPSGPDWGELSIWNSLDACPEKMATICGYNQEATEMALIAWMEKGSGLILSEDERLSFKKEVHLISDEVRQSWKFKRTSPKATTWEEEPECEEGTSDDESSS